MPVLTVPACPRRSWWWSATPTSPSIRLPRATIRNIVEFEQDYPDARTSCSSRTTARRRPSSSGQLGHRQEPRAPQEEPLERVRRRGQDRRLRRRLRARRGRLLAKTIDELGDSHGVKPKDVAVFYRTNAQSRALEEVFVRVGLPTRSSGARGSTSAARSRTRWPTWRVLSTPLTRSKTCAGSSTSPSGASATAPRRASRPRRARAHPLHRRPRPPRGRPAIATRSVSAIKGFTALLEELRAVAERDDTGVSDLLEAVVEKTGYLAELRASHDPQDETRIENLAELVAVAREFDENRAETVRWPPSRTSSSRCRWWRTPTRFLTARRRRTRGSSRS